MPTTENINLPIYTDEETPDLSTTGNYNHAMEIIDSKFGELEAKDTELADGIANEREARIEGDNTLDSKLATETQARTDADAALDAAYKSADTALDSKLAAETQARTDADAALDTAYKAANNALSLRIDGAEGEISYLKSEDWFNFAPSPETHKYLKEDYEQMLSRWPKCYMLLNITNGQDKVLRPVFWPIRRTDTHVYLRTVLQTKQDNVPGFLIYEIRVGLNEDDSVNVTGKPYFIPLVTWETLSNKPFTTIGPGLKVVNGALTVDTSAISGIE